MFLSSPTHTLFNPFNESKSKIAGDVEEREFPGTTTVATTRPRLEKNLELWYGCLDHTFPEEVVISS